MHHNLENLEEIKEELEELRENLEKLRQRDEKKIKKSEENIRQSIKRMFSIKEDAASNEEIRDRIISGGKVSGTNLVILVCAILIASVGLNTNSVAVIIGAMLISPLMGSILAIAYGTASNNAYLIERHSIGFVAQIFFSVITATIYFLLSPVKDATEQIIARTNPGFFDVIVAIAGGIAGIVGQTRKDKSNNIIPGVAIATALMPPLCTCGYAIANQEWKMFIGAFYLFFINAYFIFISAESVLAILETPHVKAIDDKQWRKSRKKMLRNTIIVLLPIIIISYSL